VTLFGVMIVPLGVVSIGFIIIQPIVIGTWCTLCLIGAAAMLVQIPYSVDELAATLEFLWRRKKAGAPVLKIFFTGDTDKGERKEEAGDFERPPAAILRDAVTGGVGLPWNLGLCILIGIWLMFTRLTLGVDGSIANTDHLIGSLVLTATVTALAEIARPVRLLNTGFGMALLIVPFVLGAPWISIASSTVCGILLILLSLQRGRIREKWGSLGRYII
jgi:hypothetical protein